MSIHSSSSIHPSLVCPLRGGGGWGGGIYSGQVTRPSQETNTGTDTHYTMSIGNMLALWNGTGEPGENIKKYIYPHRDTKAGKQT